MKFETILEYTDAISVLREKNLKMIDDAKLQVRSLNDNENSDFEANKAEIISLQAEMKELERTLNDANNNKNFKNISIDRKMENNYSILRAIKEAYNKGEKTVDLNRAFKVTGVDGEGDDTVQTSIFDVLSPLSEDNVLVAAGAQVKTNLRDSAQLAVYNEGAAKWLDENEEADDMGGSFTQVLLSPKRIGAYVPISKLWLTQSVNGCEEEIRKDIAKQIWAQIENQLLSDEAGTATVPAGLLHGLTASEVTNYKELVTLEADLRAAKFRNVKAIVSPYAEAEFKSRIKGTNATGMQMENGKLDGMDTFVTSRLEDKKFLLGDFSQLIIGFWGNVEMQLIEDSYYAKRGQVCIVLNGYADAKLARSGAVVLGDADDSE